MAMVPAPGHESAAETEGLKSQQEGVPGFRTMDDTSSIANRTIVTNSHEQLQLQQDRSRARLLSMATKQPLLQQKPKQRVKTLAQKQRLEEDSRPRMSVATDHESGSQTAAAAAATVSCVQQLQPTLSKDSEILRQSAETLKSIREDAAVAAGYNAYSGRHNGCRNHACEGATVGEPAPIATYAHINRNDSAPDGSIANAAATVFAYPRANEARSAPNACVCPGCNRGTDHLDFSVELDDRTAYQQLGAWMPPCVQTAPASCRLQLSNPNTHFSAQNTWPQWYSWSIGHWLQWQWHVYMSQVRQWQWHAYAHARARY
jgi:hypothetical protein